MNKVFLIGNLTRDPELSETNSGVSLCRFAIAVNRRFSGGDAERQTDFFNVTAFRGLADNIARFCKKGNKVAVVGSIQIRNYEDNNGQRRTFVDVVADDVEFLTPKTAAPRTTITRPPRPKRSPPSNPSRTTGTSRSKAERTIRTRGKSKGRRTRPRASGPAAIRQSI